MHETYPSKIDYEQISGDFEIYKGSWSLQKYSTKGTILTYVSEIKPSFVSKVNTTLQLFTIFFALLLKMNGVEPHFHEAFMVLCWLTAIFTAISGGDYLLKGMKLFNRGDGNSEKT
jgi:phosphatidylglycerophosphate synthase